MKLDRVRSQFFRRPAARSRRRDPRCDRSSRGCIDSRRIVRRVAQPLGHHVRRADRACGRGRVRGYSRGGASGSISASTRASIRASAPRMSFPSFRWKIRRWTTASSSRGSSESASGMSSAFRSTCTSAPHRGPTRVNLADVRRGQFEASARRARHESGSRARLRAEHIHRSAGAIAIGARPFLVAYNVYLGRVIEPRRCEVDREAGARIIGRLQGGKGSRSRGRRPGAGLDESRGHRADRRFTRYSIS